MKGPLYKKDQTNLENDYWTDRANFAKLKTKKLQKYPIDLKILKNIKKPGLN